MESNASLISATASQDQTLAKLGLGGAADGGSGGEVLGRPVAVWLVRC